MEVEQPIMEQPEEKIVSRKRKVSKGNCYTYFFVANKLHQKFISQICRPNYFSNSTMSKRFWLRMAYR